VLDDPEGHIAREVSRPELPQIRDVALAHIDAQFTGAAHDVRVPVEPDRPASVGVKPLDPCA
jgi:hypothetical protein